CSPDRHGPALSVSAGRFGECPRVAECTDNIWSPTYAPRALGVATWLLGAPEAAATLVRAALRTTREIDHPIGVALCLDALAWITASQKRAAAAATLLGAADAAWAAIPAALQPALQHHRDVAIAAAGEALTEAAFQSAFAAGTAMSQAEAIAFALREPPSAAERPAGRPGGDRVRLTLREQEVARLVARGQSNSQIAGELVISARTAETHVRKIIDKLGGVTRAQIAA